MGLTSRRPREPCSLTFLLAWSLLATSCAFIVRNACEESGDFSVIRQNYILNGSVFSTIHNQTFQSCKYHCISNYSCKSFNMENKEPGECQLNSETMGIGNKTTFLFRKFGWTFSSTSYIETNLGKHCQKYKPCKSGQLCMSTCTCPGYECLDSCITHDKTAPECPDVIGLKNCALKKSATLSKLNSYLKSHPKGGDPSNAVNGIYETKADECAVSEHNESNPVFTIDLGKIVEIHDVTISGGCMGPFDIHVTGSDPSGSHEVCREGLVLTSYEIRTFTCDNKIDGRYVKIKGNNNWLLLCEVEVQGIC